MKEKRFQLRLSVDDFDLLEQIAHDVGVSMSEVVRSAIESPWMKAFHTAHVESAIKRHREELQRLEGLVATEEAV